MWESVFFWIFGGMAAVLGILVIVLKNPVHCAVALVGNMFSLAALFVLLDAHFLAALQVLVYAGAIMVLILFVIMLLNLKPDELGKAKQTATKVIGAVLVGLVGILVISLLKGKGAADMPAVSADYGTLETVGRLIFSKYLLSFEVASIVLLAAILGAVGIAKKKIW